MNATSNSLIDSFGRKHDYLRISLTERCNLRCFYCMPEEGIPLRPASHFMSTDEVLGIAEKFVQLGVNKIRLTGGEPLIRSDIESVLRGLAKLPVELAITTNGILIDKYIDLLEECGVTKLNVSLDTLKPEKFNTITRRDYFSRVMNNIRLLIDRKFQVKLNAVIIKGVNEAEIVDFIDFTRENPVEYRFIEFMPFDGNKWNFSKCLSNKEIVERVRDVFGNSLTRMIDGPNDTAQHYRINGHAGSFAVISSITNPFCDTCNRIRLTADGKIKNCLFSGSETNLLEVYRKGEDITAAILDSVLKKKLRRAGMNDENDLNRQATSFPNRSMVTIGG